MRVVLIVVGANLGGFAHAHLARTAAGNPFFARQADVGALWPAYADSATTMLRSDTHPIARYGTDYLAVLACATADSDGLLAIALVASVGVGPALLEQRLRPWPMPVVGGVVVLIILGCGLLGEGLRRQREGETGRRFALVDTLLDRRAGGPPVLVGKLFPGAAGRWPPLAWRSWLWAAGCCSAPAHSA